MEGGLFLFGLLIVLFALYRLVARKLATPRATVRMLLRRYHAFERRGLPEQDGLYRVLTGRRGWRNLPSAFIAEIVARLGSKESVFRFVALAEEHRFNRKQLPAIANNPNRETAMREVALWLCDFGNRLQRENHLKEAEFVQKLALGLQPDQPFTQLPLAATYYKMARYDQAAPLFKEGLAQLAKSADGAGPRSETLAFLDGIEPGATLKDPRAEYATMYATCLKLTGNRLS
jgi:tetratricopeptide (TPR) repeat protein